MTRQAGAVLAAIAVAAVVLVAPGPSQPKLALGQSKISAQELHFAQYGEGQGLSSSLFLLNPALDRTASVLLELRSSGGEMLRDGLPAIEQIPPLGLLHRSSPLGGRLVTGSVRAASYQRLSGSILFGGANGLAGVAGVQTQSDFLLPVVMNLPEQVRTGIAIANPLFEAIDAALILYDSDGQPIADGAVNLAVPSQGQVARFADELFQSTGLDLGEFSGILRVSSACGLAAMVLRASPGEFATFPVSAVAQGGSPWKGLFPQLASGPGISSTLLLLNPSPNQPASVQLETHLREAGAESARRKLAESLDISPLGLAVVPLPESPVLQIGWASLESGHPLGATLVLSGDFGVAAVPAVQALSHFLSPVEAAAEQGISTGIALANLNSVGCQTEVRLRDQQGQPASNSRVLSMQPAEQISAQAFELFDEIDLSSFLGSIEVSSDCPLAAAAIRQSPGQFATLGVAEVQASLVQDLFVSSRNTHSVKRYREGSGEFLGDFVPPGAGGLQATQEVAIGPDGNLYVSGRGNNAILRYSATGEFLGAFTTGYQLDNPTKMTFGPDNLIYVSQWGVQQSSVARFDALTGAFVDEATPNLNQPMSHAWDRAGRLYVATFGDRDVRRFAPGGSLIDVVAGPPHLKGPVNLWFGLDEDLFVVDWEAGAVVRFDALTFESKGIFISGLVRTEGVTMGPDGAFYLCDWQLNRINRYDAFNGQFLGIFTQQGGILQPNSLTFGPSPPG